MTYLLICAALGYLALSVTAAWAMNRSLEARDRTIEILQSQNGKLLDRIQHPERIQVPHVKAQTPDLERQRRIDAAMRKVGQVVPGTNLADGDA